MLIEQSAYANRWRRVSPAAKGVFALGGFVAAFVAGAPSVAVAVGALLAAVTLVGAAVPLGCYLRVLAPAFFFLGMSSLSLAVSLNFNAVGGGLEYQWSPSGLSKVAEVGARSLAALAALLFLVLTTPLSDLIALLRRLKAPEVLLEIMVLCYRMLFVFSSAAQETLTAQSARLGYATPRLAMRSLGALAANLTLQVWQRAHALHLAAQARNNEGPLRFLQPVFANAGRDMAIATGAGTTLIGLTFAWPLP